MQRLLILLLAAFLSPAQALNEGGGAQVCKPANPAYNQTQICKTQHNWGTNLFRNYSRIADLTTDVCVQGPAHVEISGKLGLVHMNLSNYPYTHPIYPGHSGPVGWTVRVGYRYAATPGGLGPRPVYAEPGTWANSGVTFINGNKSAGNIRDYTAHYAEANLDAYLYVETPGCYRFEVWGKSESALAPHTDGLASVMRDTNQWWNDTYGSMKTKVTPVN